MSVPPGKGGKPSAKSPIISVKIQHGLTVTKFIPRLKFFVNSFFRLKFQQIMQIPRSSPTQSANYAKLAHFVNLFYIMFQAPAPAENPAEFQRITQIPRNSPTQSANYAKFAPFINIVHYVSDA